MLAMIGAERPEPTVLRAAAEGWGPMLRWDGEYLEEVAGEEPLEITVVTEAGAFEVRQDHIWRPPKSTMKLGDLTRLLRLQTDANLTLYSRQAPLWPMSGLLADLAPLPWMGPLRLNDLNVWLGDGHFRNTLHNDPYDNFLCQVLSPKSHCCCVRPRHILHPFTHHAAPPRPIHTAPTAHTRCAGISICCYTRPSPRPICTTTAGGTCRLATFPAGASTIAGTRGSSLITRRGSTALRPISRRSPSLRRRCRRRATPTCSRLTAEAHTGHASSSCMHPPLACILLLHASSSCMHPPLASTLLLCVSIQCTDMNPACVTGPIASTCHVAGITTSSPRLIRSVGTIWLSTSG